MPSSSGVLTRRSPCGVHASIRASGTRAHTRAVQPDGTVSRRGVDSAPPPSPAGTTRVVVKSAAADPADGADVADGAVAEDAAEGAAEEGCAAEDAGAGPGP